MDGQTGRQTYRVTSDQIWVEKLIYNDFSSGELNTLKIEILKNSDNTRNIEGIQQHNSLCRSPEQQFSSPKKEQTFDYIFIYALRFRTISCHYSFKCYHSVTQSSVAVANLHLTHDIGVPTVIDKINIWSSYGSNIFKSLHDNLSA